MHPPASGRYPETASLEHVEGAWIAEQQVMVEGGKIHEYRVTMRVILVLKD